MSDRQHLSSLAVSAAAVAVALGAIVSMAFWLGWRGAVGFLTILGGFLAWFYGGPRRDLTSRERSDERDGPGNA
ncbi:MAG TPA: hypothetical protein VLT62_19395 [Candidatus Methylomirabilis sp.]|nr:hypothetical protein [Candidatus Methylomirabilis sp.]